jgi:hypothetical protein
MVQSNPIDDALRAAGELLSVEGKLFEIVVVGGASLSLLGFVNRTTDDVDVIATAVRDPDSGAVNLNPPPHPLPESLRKAITTVARDFGLRPDWINAEIAAQWRTGLPPGIADDLTWRDYGALQVGLAGRRTLITMKLFAAVDQGPGSVHYQDLVALSPTSQDLEESGRWVRTQDAAPAFAEMVDQVITHVNHDARDDDRGNH